MCDADHAQIAGPGLREYFWYAMLPVIGDIGHECLGAEAPVPVGRFAQIDPEGITKTAVGAVFPHIILIGQVGLTRPMCT